MKRYLPKKRGFTLIELIVVILILACLLGCVVGAKSCFMHAIR